MRVIVIARVQRKFNLNEVGPFKSLMAAGKKLFLSQLVCVLRALYLFPDGRRWKRVCAGCVGSFIMLAAFPEAAGSVAGVNGWEAGFV